ncbi:MAG: AI-2E family transporter [Helicobacteraceae bacterium]|nr:AI-2E family transporter [Helicobacteraceae bacterium]
MNSNRFFLLCVLLITLYLMFRLYLPFLIDITIASLLAIAMSSVNLYIKKIVKYSFFSSILTTTILLLLFFAPISYVVTTATNLIHFDANPIEKIVQYISAIDLSLPESMDFIKPNIKEYLDEAKISSAFVSFARAMGEKSAGFIKDMALIVIFFFFATYYGKNLAIYFQSVLPMNKKEASDIFFEVANVMSVVLYSIILTAVLEGILFSLIGAAYGYDPLLLGILYGFASLVPVVGGALIWAPIALIELSNGNTVSAVIIAVYSFIGIGLVDNFVKPIIIKYVNRLLLKTPVYFNELLIFFSIIAGLASFGFWGMILGPAITTFFISLLKLYRSIKENSLKTIGQNEKK